MISGAWKSWCISSELSARPGRGSYQSRWGIHPCVWCSYIHTLQFPDLHMSIHTCTHTGRCSSTKHTQQTGSLRATIPHLQRCHISLVPSARLSLSTQCLLGSLKAQNLSRLMIPYVSQSMMSSEEEEPERPMQRRHYEKAHMFTYMCLKWRNRKCWDSHLFMNIWKSVRGPGGVAQLVGASSHTPEGCEFDP